MNSDLQLSATAASEALSSSNTTVSTATGARIAGLDGLRGLSIALVVVAHAGFGHVVPGGFGVTIFFFISGFIITSLLLKEYAGTGSIDFKAFYVRRSFRILPVLFCYLLVTTLYVFAVSGEIDWPHLLAALAFYYNYYFLLWSTHTGDFAIFHPYSIVWSLAVEEHFYFIFPVLLYYFRGRFRSLLMLMAIACVLVLLWRLYLVFGVGLDDLVYNRIYKSTDTRFDAIIYGAMFSIAVHVYGPSIITALSGNSALCGGLFLLLLSLTVRDDNFRESLRYSVQGVGLALIFGGCLTPGALCARLLGNPVLLYLGKISYSLYLWHWAVYVVMERSWDPNKSIPAALVMMVCSVLIAHVSQRYIEQPALKWRRKFISH